MLTSTAADVPTVLTRLQASVCLSPQKPSHNRFSTCLFKNKQTRIVSSSFSHSCCLNPMPSFTISPLVTLKHSHTPQCWPGLPFTEVIFSCHSTSPSLQNSCCSIAPLCPNLSPQPCQDSLPAWFTVTGESCLHVLK